MVRTFSLNGTLVTATDGQTILESAREHGCAIPTLCHLDGLDPIAGCRLCLVEIEGSSKLQPACATPIGDGMSVRTHSPRLENYRRMIIELLFSERNHVCSTCVSNGHCELQSRAVDVGMTHSRFPYLSPECSIDASHDRFVLDHNRCILCSRCVRVCDDVEGAHSWDLKHRGARTRVVMDLDQPWGESTSCTGCGKCVEVCPTGTLFRHGVSAGQMVKHPEFLAQLRHARGRKHE